MGVKITFLMKNGFFEKKVFGEAWIRDLLG